MNFLFYFTEIKLKKKWKYLRDQFAIELSKMKLPKSGAAASDMETPKWPHFKLLHFLKDIVKPRSSSGNLNVGHDVSIDLVAKKISVPDESGLNVGTEWASNLSVVNEDTQYQDEALEDESVISLRTDTTEDNCTVTSNEQIETSSVQAPLATHSAYGAVKKRVKRTFKETVFELEKQKLEILREKIKKRESRENVEDDDLHFLKSLLPHIKMIPQHKKLSFRSKIQEVVERFAYPSTCYQAQSPSSYSSLSNPDCNMVYTPLTTLPTSVSNENSVIDSHDGNTMANIEQYCSL